MTRKTDVTQTTVDGPHDSECRATDLVKRFTPSDHFPQNNTPAEHVALLRVVGT